MRQLAAIMFADMTGYTALMQANEQEARQKRKRLKDVLETYIPLFNGRLVQYYGDGSLSIFSSALDAVRSALQIQVALQQEPKTEVRIGIHLGDVSVEEEAVFGDGINLASRIESLALPGSVFISEKIYDEIKNHPDIDTVELGYFELKNIKNPVRVFALDQPGIVIPARDALRGKTKQPHNRLAILPFVNMSADPENEYFSDGITEELLNALTKVDGLQVTSRTSSFAFKGKQEDIREIATRLNVDKVLEGSVRRAGSRVRVTAQLINAADGYHIWSESYDRDLTDIFIVQDEISHKIADKLRAGMAQNALVPEAVTEPTKNIEAYNLFLKGLHYYNKLTPADAYKAIDYLEKAIALEPDFARAYACIAGACAYLGVTGQMPTAKAFDTVHRYSQKALQLDESSAKGYVALGSAYLFYDWKWNEAHTALKKARELNPADTQAYQLLAFYYIITGHKKKALAIMQEALLVDPLSPMVNHYLGDMYMANEQYDEVIRTAEHILEMFPNLRLSLELKGWAIGMKGQWQEALAIFEEVQRLTGHPLKGQTPLAFAYGKLGQVDKALECVAKMEQRAREDPNAVIDSDLAMAWWGIGDKERSIEYMFRCIEKRLGPIALYLEYPMFSELKQDPRYDVLKQQLNLPAYAVAPNQPDSIHH